MARENAAWQLEDFVDSLVVELDKTRETLAVKAINKPLSYTVKEVALDLNIFPAFDGDRVSFVTAQPGEVGASKVSIQLSSITDQQVRATSKMPATKSDIEIDDINIDRTTKKKLRKLGVQSLNDLQQLEKKNVDLKKYSDTDIDYRTLANQIQKARRSQNPPRVHAVSLSQQAASPPCLVIEGENLAVDPQFAPVAVLNQQLAEVTFSSDKELRVQIAPGNAFKESSELILAVDPFAVLRLKVNGGGRRP